MNADASSVYDELLLTNDSVGQNAWSKFLFNLDSQTSHKTRITEGANNAGEKAKDPSKLAKVRRTGPSIFLNKRIMVSC